ncbi:MAG: VOC family protein [Planctomycetota bacterium]|jgi:uncharacterized glyoxalase superfamily protein PhnB|nr:VOC family protein [Planctomycetota bacterium]
MSVNPIPEGFHTVTPYLVVEDGSRQIEFLEKAFGGEETHRSNRPDGSIMHAQMQIGDSMVMLGEATGEFLPMQSMIYLYVPDCDKLYGQAIQAGAESLMEPADQFYGDRNAGIKDPLGNMWWIGTRLEDVSEEEITKRAAKAFGESQS